MLTCTHLPTGVSQIKCAIFYDHWRLCDARNWHRDSLFALILSIYITFPTDWYICKLNLEVEISPLHFTAANCHMVRWPERHGIAGSHSLPQGSGWGTQRSRIRFPVLTSTKRGYCAARSLPMALRRLGSVERRLEWLQRRRGRRGRRRDSPRRLPRYSTGMPRWWERSRSSARYYHHGAKAHRWGRHGNLGRKHRHQWAIKSSICTL